MGTIRKLAICLLTGVVVAFVLQRIIYRIIWEFGDKFIPPPVYAIAGLVLVVAAALVFRRRVMAGWQGILGAFFGRSFPFFCLIGVLQIVGACLLMFRRTRLFGAIFLLPVVLNIVLLNIFYGFDAGDTVHALILLVGLSCLILVHWRRLVAVFFGEDSGGPGGCWGKIVWRRG